MGENLEPFEIQREALAERLKLKEQWESQISILNETGILQLLPESQELGIVGIDGEEYPIPDYKEIIDRLTPEKAQILEQKIEQGFSKMLLVPFGMSMETLAQRYREVVLKKSNEETLLDTDGLRIELDKNNPFPNLISLNTDIDKRLSYYPSNFEEQEGFTKSEILSRGAGFKIEFIEDRPDLSDNRQAQGGRFSPPSRSMPARYLEIIQNDENMSNEQGWTMETWLTYAITNLKERNQQIDSNRWGKFSWLLGAYFPAQAPSVPIVMYAGWSKGKAELFSGEFDDRSTNASLRTSVEI